MATRTGTTRATTTSGVARSADDSAKRQGLAGFSFLDLLHAWLDFRRTKRNSASALAFERDLEDNLRDIYDRLIAGTWSPGPSICFVIQRPKPREVWAASCGDRVVHWALHNAIAPAIYRSFIADSCACIPGRGTLYAVERLEAKVRCLTQGWQKPAYYLKCDVANFFVSIDKPRLRALLERRIADPGWLSLATVILMHDPRRDVVLQSSAAELALIPPHKSLFNAPVDKGLPIGNLSSQFFANIYLDELDQFVKHRIGARHYVRYVDDFVLLHESPRWLNVARDAIADFIDERLALQLNDRKTVLQPVRRGLDFAGQVIRPHRRTLRRRTYNDALARTAATPAQDLLETANSYFGLLRQTTHSHRDRARLANLMRRRGHVVNRDLTQTYRRAHGR